MTDSDADEPVAPLKQQSKGKSRATDRALAGLGLVLAGLSAFFPWYVFFNSDKFGISVTEGNRTRELPDWPARNVFSVSPLAMINRNETNKKLNGTVDPLTTATVSNIGREDDKGPAADEDQPFPGKAGFRLLHVSNGRALIEDSTGMYVVRIGSILPDESKLAALEQRDGKWVIVTSRGDVYGNN
ncbi:MULTISPECIES: flagellar protein [unclassified Sinorhizobium]|uniref:flagellar protein n=1 Tax=unclassified Sinorhizobium TaxID=2613772 RepID=UPI003525F4E8